MKKILTASTVAILAFAVVASAATFSANLTVGSKGADVTALQTALIAGGYSIPAGATGYFGSQTKSAVQKYQAAKGIPATGFVGPLTRAALNGGVATVSTATCPVGFTCAPISGTTPVVGAPAGITTPGIAGTLAVSLWSTPSGVTAYKGQSYDLAGYKVQASASDMQLSNLSFDFDTRFWLFASAVTVKDENGVVVGSVGSLDASKFTELTVGSKYRINIPVNGIVVNAAKAKYLTLNATFLPMTDRNSGPINVIGAQVRAVDGTGVTDTESVTDIRLFTYQGSNIGQLILTNDTSSPATQVIQVSTFAQTQNVPLAIYDIKSQNQPGTLQSLTIGLNISSSTLPVGSLIANLQLKAGGLTYSASSLSSSSATFTNLSIPLAADVYVPVAISATLAQDTNDVYDNIYIYTTLSAANISAIDSTYNIITPNSVILNSNAQSFTSSGVAIGTLSPVGLVITANSGASTTATFGYVYSLTAGNNPIYISATSTNAVGVVTTGSVGTVNLVSFRDNDSTNDLANGYFYIAPGQTKTFTLSYQSKGSVGSVSGTYSINQLNYGTGYSAGAITGAGSLSASTIGNTLITNLSY